MNHHIVIQTERRSPAVTDMGEDRSRMAISIQGPVPTGPAQLHTLSIADLSHHDWTPAQYIYVARWDGIAPWIEVLKGDHHALNMGYAGWPTVTEAEWAAQEVLEGRT